jgi:hypothetical protein
MDVKKIKVGKLDVITKCPDGKDKYLVSAINVGDVEWWSHSAHKKAFPGFRGSAKLVKIDDKYFVALCTTTVDTIFPLGSISEMTWTPDGDYVCRGFGLDQRVDAKTAIAAELSLTPCWTSGEYVVVEEHRRLEAQTQLLAQRAAREAERQVELARKKKEEDDRAQAVAERRMKKLGIMARTKIFVRVEGVNRPHIPVVGDEWQVSGT